MMEQVLACVEKTDILEGEMPRIQMVMAKTLAKQIGSTVVDMKIDQSECKSCPICPNPHYHLVGTVR